MGTWSGEGSDPLGPSQAGSSDHGAATPPGRDSEEPPAPTEVEHRLYEARQRGDWAAYLDVLAGTDLYHAFPRRKADEAPDGTWSISTRDPRSGMPCYVVLTRGVLPAPAPDPVFSCRTLRDWARNWPDARAGLSVNPGTPYEAYFPATPEHRALWFARSDHVAPEPAPALRTLHFGGPLHGSVAFGLACGAHLCVRNGTLWNSLSWHGQGIDGERRRLRESWGIRNRTDWQRVVQELLTDGSSSPAWDFVLDVRQILARDYAGAVDAPHWREATERAVRRRMAERVPDSPAELETRSTEVDAQVVRLNRLIGRITRYEARFRADGLLPDGKFVRSVEAWDYGRASKMARWGLGARYCDIAEAEQTVLHAGRLSNINYRSWEDFSAGFILGRCLHFDEEEFGPWYQEMLEAHSILTTEPGSPWLNISWRGRQRHAR